MTQPKHILNADELNRAIARIAHEILEKNKGSGGLVLIGIRSGGVLLAKRFQEKLLFTTWGVRGFAKDCCLGQGRFFCARKILNTKILW